MSELVFISFTIVLFFLFLWRLRKIEKELKLVLHNIDDIIELCHDNHQDLCRIRLNLMKNSQKGGNCEY